MATAISIGQILEALGTSPDVRKAVRDAPVRMFKPKKGGAVIRVDGRTYMMGPSKAKPPMEERVPKITAGLVYQGREKKTTFKMKNMMGNAPKGGAIITVGGKKHVLKPEAKKSRGIKIEVDGKTFQQKETETMKEFSARVRKEMGS